MKHNAKENKPQGNVSRTLSYYKNLEFSGWIKLPLISLQVNVIVATKALVCRYLQHYICSGKHESVNVLIAKVYRKILIMFQ